MQPNNLAVCLIVAFTTWTSASNERQDVLARGRGYFYQQPQQGPSFDNSPANRQSKPAETYLSPTTSSLAKTTAQKDVAEQIEELPEADAVVLRTAAIFDANLQSLVPQRVYKGTKAHNLRSKPAESTSAVNQRRQHIVPTEPTSFLTETRPVGYHYERPAVDIDRTFQHYQLGSQLPPRRRGFVQRLKLHDAYGKSAESCCNKDIQAVQQERGAKRPKTRRLHPYTEAIIGPQYFNTQDNYLQSLSDPSELQFDTERND